MCIGGGHPNDTNHTLLRPMTNKIDAITAESIRFIIEQAESKGDEAVQADWADTQALEIYNEFKDQELKGIPGTDLAFNELLKTHVNPQDLAGSNRIIVDGLGDDALTGGEGMDVFVFSNNPLIHFEENKIADFEGHDTVVFADTFENMGLNVRADRDANKVFVKSEITGHTVLEVDMDASSVSIGSSTFNGSHSQPGQLERVYTDGNDAFHLDMVNWNIDAFMTYDI